MSFLSRTFVEDLDDGTFRLTHPLIYATDIRGKQESIKVPAGFVTDFYSVPRIAQGLVSRVPGSIAPAIVHDYLFATAGQDGDFTMGECNAILGEAMRAKKVDWWTRTKIMSGIRMGSWIAWHKCVKAWEANRDKPMTNPENVGLGPQE